jgi:NAD(P)-dependent dehydrogenase (short-subunit alcohol dehydrogenase family)
MPMAGLGEFNGKAALITGGSGGIGLHIAEQLAEAGAHIFINGRSAERGERAVAKLREIRRNVRFIGGDCASYQDAAAASTPPGHCRKARHSDQRGGGGRDRADPIR